MEQVFDSEEKCLIAMLQAQIKIQQSQIKDLTDLQYLGNEMHMLDIEEMKKDITILKNYFVYNKGN